MNSTEYNDYIISLKNDIAKNVKEKMEDMGSCINEIDIILNIICPEIYDRNNVPHCKNDCWNEECPRYRKVI